jgi:murein hydrolase activator
VREQRKVTRWSAGTVKALLCFIIALVATFNTTPILYAETDTQHAAEETQAKQKLDQVRTEIRKISDAQKKTDIEKSQNVAALRDQELKIAASAKELRTFDQQLATQQTKLDQLTTQRDALDVKLKTQRDALAALVRSAYIMGHNEELKLLLAQDDISSIGRMLAYYHYFEHARVGEIDNLLKDLESLAQVQSAIERETAVLQTDREQRAAEAQRLETERADRRVVLGQLDATLKDEATRLAALGKDEKGLLDLLEKLRDIFADIPKQIAGAEPFVQLRGRLIWPLHGKLQASSAAAASEGENHGVLIAAPVGGEVHAVSHGRVVFADWLRGFGLLLIVDHADGYLSLYGCNETLLKDVGDWVNSNEVVATSGDSGGHGAPGLYFELRHDGKAVDVRAWMKGSSR